jgi:hypothetical protein
MPVAEWHGRAERARNAAESINDITISHWLEMIEQLAEREPAAA